MDEVLLRRGAFCTSCGAPMANGACSAGCDEDKLDEPAAMPAGDTQIAGARHQGEPSHHRRGWVRPALFGALAVLVLTALIAEYLHIDDKIVALRRDLQQDRSRQSSLDARLNALDDRLDTQADRLAAAQNQLNAHPAAAMIAKQAAPSVFTIHAGDWLGSGFVVRNRGRRSQLLTNYHVVASVYDDGETAVRVQQGDVSYDGEIIDVSQANDLAVISVNHALPALSLAPRAARVGDAVLALGSPNGLAGTVTSGIVSAYRKLSDGAQYLQFSAPISPGNSGGPVLDETGRVLGVAVMKDVRDATEGISFAVPTARVCDALDVC